MEGLDHVKELLIRQMELINEAAEAKGDVRDLANAAEAMTEIAKTLISMEKQTTVQAIWGMSD